MLEILNIRGQQCTGCGACANVCPKKAISMQPDGEGFIQPTVNEDFCVNCHLCDKTCPVLNPKYENKSVDSCYAMWAQDDVRAATSTAGFFLLAARHTLSQKGAVYGAAWTDNWDVEHVRAENEQELSRIVKSKYAQSNTGNAYQLAKKDLEEGKQVLYSGCPCQIAGLYGYLGKKRYDNLTTVEIICHGVPSSKVLKKYLKDTFANKEITSIDFRDKKHFAWSSNANIHFSDGSSYRNNAQKDAFYRAFLPCMSLRKSCATCPFSRLPRQADISIGDFWGVADFDRSWDDRKGTGLVLVNSQQGQNLFDILRPQFQRVEQFPLDAALRVNKTIIHPFHPHPGRKHFFSSLDLLPFDKLVDHALDHKYDVGIVGLWYGINYGSVLTYYALYHLVRDIGYDPVFLPKPPHLWNDNFSRPDGFAQRFILPRCNAFNPYPSRDEIYRMNDRCKDFILGSDVVWNYSICGKDVDQYFFLDWVESGHKKIAFAASFGNALTGPETYTTKAIFNMRKFDGIAVREKSSVGIVEHMTDRTDVQWVLDPVFLCNPDVYKREIIPQERAEKYAFAYLLQVSEIDKKKKVFEALEKERGFDIKICGNPNEMHLAKPLWGDMLLPELSIPQWLEKINHAEVYIGDSYHGMCFAIMFHTPFVTVYTDNEREASNARLESLLRILGLEDRILYGKEITPENVMKIMDTEIDWDDVDRRLQEARIPSIEWLKNKLSQPNAAPTADQIIADEFKRKVAEQSIRQDALQHRIHVLEQENARLREEQANSTLGAKLRLYKALTLEYYHDYGTKATILKIFQTVKNKLFH